MRLTITGWFRADSRHRGIGRPWYLLLMFGMLFSCGNEEVEIMDPEPGVSRALAEQRAARISNLAYGLSFDLPASPGEPVTGQVTLDFRLADADEPLVLDFRGPPESVSGLRLDGETVSYRQPPGHIVIPSDALVPGDHQLSMDFHSADAALNRQDDFLYALFVPDRAATAFPLFDQPDLKARFTLQLNVPETWQALSNGALLSREAVTTESGRELLHFAETERISSYLFAFAAGELQVETAQRGGREFRLFHRETDEETLLRNRDALFDLHAEALDWLEDYTGIAHPYGKFDFFAIPAFQFGGMEHPGAIWYRAESLFLDPSATRAQELGRASLIAHETAHMWFGNLVTMRWFNDVWMKEVFANFMAAKIAGPAFPDLDLSLRFFQAHHPSAYAVDRTAGANPIRQPLANLQDAGSLYGAIIYQKAPVVMQQLENLLGEELLRDGLQEYLNRYQHGNASWPELIEILDGLSTLDLEQWSWVWINEPGRPRIEADWTGDGIRLRQRDDWPARDLLWPQTLTVAVQRHGQLQEYPVSLQESETFLPLAAGEAPDFILPGADGVAYGRFVLDAGSRQQLLQGVHELSQPLHRAVTWQALWEEMLDHELAPTDFVDAAIAGIEREHDQLVAQQVLGLLQAAWWRHLDQEQRLLRTDVLEERLWQALERGEEAGRKGTYFRALMSMSLSPDGVDRLYDIWRNERPPEGLPLEEQQYINLAEALALRGISQADAILATQEDRIRNNDRLARFRFVRPAFAADAAAREALFLDFMALENRRREAWVLDAVAAIHHPLRAGDTRHLLRPGLELVPEIQQTGDIFFPLRWLNALLNGHSSPEAAAIVRQYLEEREELPLHLRQKVLQAADELFRASAH